MIIPASGNIAADRKPESVTRAILFIHTPIQRNLVGV